MKNTEETKMNTKVNMQSAKGNLVGEPKFKTLESGLKLAEMTIKQSYPLGKPIEGEKQEYINNYHNVVAFGKNAENIKKAGFKKGDFVEVEGKSYFSTYTKEGVEGKNYVNKIIVKKSQLLETGVKPFQSTNNHIELIGNLTKDPEIKTLPSGKKIANISLAHNYKVKNEEKVMYVNATVFNEKAVDHIEKNRLEKGSTIAVKGSVEPKEYLDKDGNKKYTVSINSNFVTLNVSKAPVVDKDNVITPEIDKVTKSSAKAIKKETTKTVSKGKESTAKNLAAKKPAAKIKKNKKVAVKKNVGMKM